MPIIVPNFPEMLQSAPIDSPDFRIATDAFLAKHKEALDGQPGTFKSVMAGYFKALRERFRDGQDLDELARRIGSCHVIALFSGSIRIDEKNCAEGSMAAVNCFAAEHAKTCRFCSLVLETVSRVLKLLSAATDSSEN